MKARITRSINKGKFVKVNQWCNDWFSIEQDGKMKIVSPTMLAFKQSDAKIIWDHKNNGTLFKEYEFDFTPSEFEKFVITFKKNEAPR